MSRWTLDQISKMSPAVQAQVAAQMAAFAMPPAARQAPSIDSPSPLLKSASMPVKTSKKRIRQNGAGLNKTEQAFLDYFGAKFPLWRIYPQSVTLKIGNGVRFTPDFVCQNNGFGLCAYETKGFMRDDANVKLKVAASLYPWIKFHLATRKKGEWQIQEVLP